VKVLDAHQDIRLGLACSKHPLHVVEIFPVAIKMLKMLRKILLKLWIASHTDTADNESERPVSRVIQRTHGGKLSSR